MKRLIRNTRVLVTDGAKAVVLRNEGDVSGPNLQLVHTYEQEHPPTRELGSERPGRTSVGPARRAAMENPDWHARAEADFVSEIAAVMERDLRAGEFDTLVVVASPVALGNYRKAVSKVVAQVTVAEIAKDLVNHSPGEIAAIVVAALDAG